MNAFAVRLSLMLFGALPHAHAFSVDPALLNFELGKQFSEAGSGSRACCSLGYKLKTYLGIQITQVAEFEALGPHAYAHSGKGHGKEKNGEIYTCRGGFIDTSHLRHVADWTTLLTAKIIDGLRQGPVFQIPLGREGADRMIYLDFSGAREPIDLETVLPLAQRISYELSVWHEIATWFGWSTTPVWSEMSSAFSEEDSYSNLLGSFVGAEAIRAVYSQNLSYNKIMTELIDSKLKQLEARSAELTIRALEQVKGLWWSDRGQGRRNSPDKRRNINAFGLVTPWQVPRPAEMECENAQATLVHQGLAVPQKDHLDQDLNAFFKIKFTRLNCQIRKKSAKVEIGDSDFPGLVELIGGQVREVLGPRGTFAD